MTKELKDLIENAPKQIKGYYNSLMFVSNGEYDGFWGKNGYDNILILGYETISKRWVKVSEYGDHFYISLIQMKTISFNVDIPHEYGVPRMWFDKPIFIDNTLEVSTVSGNLIEGVYDEKK